jgi:hypothetical protein
VTFETLPSSTSRAPETEIGRVALETLTVVNVAGGAAQR